MTVAPSKAPASSTDCGISSSTLAVAMVYLLSGADCCEGRGFQSSVTAVGRDVRFVLSVVELKKYPNLNNTINCVKLNWLERANPKSHLLDFQFFPRVIDYSYIRCPSPTKTQDSCTSLKAIPEFSIVHKRAKTERSIPFGSQESRPCLCFRFTKDDAKIVVCKTVASHQATIKERFSH